jgi:hypothetical protein
MVSLTPRDPAFVIVLPVSARRTLTAATVSSPNAALAILVDVPEVATCVFKSPNVIVLTILRVVPRTLVDVILLQARVIGLWNVECTHLLQSQHAIVSQMPTAKPSLPRLFRFAIYVQKLLIAAFASPPISAAIANAFPAPNVNQAFVKQFL